MAIGNIFLIALSIVCLCGVANAQLNIIDATKVGLAPAADCKANAAALLAAWKQVCECPTPSKLLIPPGDFEVAAVAFMGPCKCPSITFEIMGTLKATKDKTVYNTGDKAWIKFDDVTNLNVIGNKKGVFNGQGEAFWADSKCVHQQNCNLELPASLKFCQVTNGFLSGYTSLNSPAFHHHVVGCKNFTADALNVVAPAESPNTDGMHISQSSGVKVINSHFATGDDCLSIGHGCRDITIAHNDCGPGHGISVGSLGKYKDEEPVSNVMITDCTFTKTDNGARIKTWSTSPDVTATNITFSNLLMTNVENPIVIDQEYGTKNPTEPSHVQLKDVHFKNIHGTTPCAKVVNLLCSKKFPCQGVDLTDIDFTYTGKEPVASCCVNAKAVFGGKQNPPPPVCT